MTRHLSDTRNAEGRVRFLIEGGRVLLLAEGQGWNHQSTHATLERAALYLALLPQLSQVLYEEAIAELERTVTRG
ncbi:hypothetical protein [Deinococcus aquiradiocola]|uniref:Uncharacterized protein n=1 Tax=Deinococcus aquiradiocola TaxID=393059 RepID=A0A917P6N7_9DEIO|nr:hypothetical protein [Deinococcus aquiradiocola]GGJ64267.1 hypothetical protein GCM10008939_05210 [Deinococcus aquiradiocola]